MPVIVKNNQSLLDLALQTSGSASSAFDLALANDLSLTDALTTGKPIAATGISSRPIADYYAAKGLKPATGMSADENQIGGIEFMGIEIDFMVS